MSKSGLNKLRRLGYQFWLPKMALKETHSKVEKEVFYLLGKEILISGNLKEFDKFSRFIPSVRRVLGLTKPNIKLISRKDALEKEFTLIIDFTLDLPFKSKKTLKFESLNLLLNDPKLKEDLYNELKE